MPPRGRVPGARLPVALLRHHRDGVPAVRHDVRRRPRLHPGGRAPCQPWMDNAPNPRSPMVFRVGVHQRGDGLLRWGGGDGILFG